LKTAHLSHYLICCRKMGSCHHCTQTKVSHQLCWTFFFSFFWKEDSFILPSNENMSELHTSYRASCSMLCPKGMYLSEHMYHVAKVTRLALVSKLVFFIKWYIMAIVPVSFNTCTMLRPLVSIGTQCD
jgi:hypothetical protein